MFNYDLLFSDHMAKCSDKAKLYYIKLCFYANNGFVPNPLSVLDSMGYDKSVLKELIDNGEILTKPDRCEVFITSYFVHNHFNPSSWTHTIYYPYWKDVMWTKKNGVATLKPRTEEKSDAQKLMEVLPPQTEENKIVDRVETDELTEDDLPFYVDPRLFKGEVQ